MLKTQKRKCMGCSGCSSACPENAILMQKDVEGFLYPMVDNDKCTECNLCNDICPSQFNSFKKDNDEKPVCLAGWNSDAKIRKESSSGGVFTLLAQYVLEQNGFVCGAAFDDENKLKHIIISDKENLFKLRGSKYLQSEIGDGYKCTSSLLNKNKLVFFTGTPCQVAGLYGYLKKDYDNLLTADLICQGTPSPMVFNNYLEEVVGGNNIIERISFRDKSKGWKNFSFNLDYKKDNKSYKLSETLSENIYLKGFLRNLYLRPCCTCCDFAMLPRVSDVTLGDFWNVGKDDKQLDDDKGTSLVLLNNRKGKEFLSKIKAFMQPSEKMPLSSAVRSNPNLSRPSKTHKNRDSFFSKLKSESSLCRLIENELGDNKVGIMNFHFENSNFGALMVSFALLKTVRRLGYETEIINYVPKEYLKWKQSSFEDFRNKFLKRTKLCKSEKDLRTLNKCFGKFITGSDQVWRWHRDYKFMFNWVAGYKTIISYAASFGVDRFERSERAQNKAQNLLSRFDAVSVREKSGVDICRDNFNIKAEHVLDPTLLLNNEDYEEIISSEKTEKIKKKYIGYMIIDEKNESIVQNESCLKDLKSEYEFINILKNKTGGYNTIPQWLDYLKNADYIVTDSFHCCTFAIIFRKQFVCIFRDKGGNGRIESLFNILDIGNYRFFNNLNDITKKSFEIKIDYEKVYKKLKEEQDKSIHFLKRSLVLKPVYKRHIDNENNHIYLFNFIPVFKIISCRDRIEIKLFGCIPLLTIKYKKKGKIKGVLFGFLPFRIKA